ncbi:MAG: M56 family metallopeptidase [Armatimonadota bacterium]
MANIMESLWAVSWQCAVLAGVVWIVTRVSGRAPASWRYALWVIVLVKLFIPPLVRPPLWLVARHGDQAYALHSQVGNKTINARPYSHDQRFGIEINEPAWVPRQPAPGMHGGDLTSILGLVWLLGVCVMSVRLTRRCWRHIRILKDSVPAGHELSDLLSGSASRLDIARVPRIRMSELARVPMLLGVLHPTVLVHPDALRMCDESELSSMLMHELAHVKRWDMIVSWIVQVAQVLFYFNPAVWLASCELRKEREIACDELVLTVSGVDRFQYASGYISALKLANGFNIADSVLAMTESTNIERGRLDMILRGAIPRMSRRWCIGLVVAVGLGLVTFRSFAGGNLLSAEAIGTAMKTQESLAGALVVKYTIETEGSPSYSGEVTRRVVTYTRTPKAFLKEVVVEKLDSGNWIPSGESGKYSYDRISREGRSLGPQMVPTITKNDLPGAMLSDPSLMETVTRLLPERPLYLMVRKYGSVAGQEEVDGHTCIKIKVAISLPKALMMKESNVMPYMVWVDPSIGFCPRRLDYYARKERYVSISMSDYREISPGVWFPMIQKTIAEQTNRKFVSKVQEVKANASMKNMSSPPIFRFRKTTSL